MVNADLKIRIKLAGKSYANDATFDGCNGGKLKKSLVKDEGRNAKFSFLLYINFKKP